MFNTFGRNQGHTVEGGEETGMRRNMRSQESEKTRSLPCHLFFLSLSLLWNSWTFFRNYWPLGSFWKILSLRVFILDAFEFSAFRDLWTLGDGRNQKEKRQATTWNAVHAPCEKESAIKGNMRLRPTTVAYTMVRQESGLGKPVPVQATRGAVSTEDSKTLIKPNKVHVHP